MFNVSKWKSDVKEIEAQIRAHKAVVRASGHNAGTSEWEWFYCLKERATMMYRIRAQYRKKLHNKKFFQVWNQGWMMQQYIVIESLDDQMAWIASHAWDFYVSPDPVHIVAS